MAESILRDRLASAGLSDRVVVDSTAVTSGEVGNPIDDRAAAVLSAHDYDPLPDHLAREVRPDHLRGSVLVLPMTAQHARVLRRMVPRGADPVIRMFRTFDPAIAAAHTDLEQDMSDWDIADPWYGGPEDFEVTLAEVEAAADGVVDHVRAMMES